MPGNQAFKGQISYYRLDDVKQKIAAQDYLITAGARQRAYEDFGWTTNDILDAYRKLKPSHFYKSEPSNIHFPDWLDFYKARINGE